MSWKTRNKAVGRERQQQRTSASKPEKPVVVQFLHPKTGRYVKVNRTTGKLTSKRSDDPYKGIPIVEGEGNVYY